MDTMSGHNVAMYNTIQYGTVQYSTVQYSTVQYSTVQYSTVQYSNRRGGWHGEEVGKLLTATGRLHCKNVTKGRREGGKERRRTSSGLGF